MLSFDPGGTEASWAYCLSTVTEGVFDPLEWGFAPIFDNLSELDFTRHFEFRDRLYSKYNESIDLVAERFIGRGFTTKISEYIPFSLGVWAASWRGNVKLLMASQWKQKLKRMNKQFTLKKNQNWWEVKFKHLIPAGYNEKHLHIQDAAAIGYWYWKVGLGVDVCLPE